MFPAGVSLPILDGAQQLADGDVVSATSHGQPSRHERLIAPKPTSEAIPHEGVKTDWKKSKSRNGCVTCKAKRRKCDETKPKCHQCSRRKVACGGYKNELRWKSFGDSRRTGGETRKETLESAVTEGRKRGGVVTDLCAKALDPALRSTSPSQSSNTAHETEMTDDHSTLNSHASLSVGHSEPKMTRTEPMDQSISIFSPGFSFGLDFDDAMAGQSVLPHPSSLARSQSPILADLDLLSSISDLDIASENGFSQHLASLLSLGMDTVLQSQFEDNPNDHDIFPLYQQPHCDSVDSETIALLFAQQTCTILSIAEDSAKNPWRTLIWPLAQDCAALHHAISAMTCFHLSKTSQHFYEHGVRHAHSSAQALAIDLNSGDFRLDTTIAAMLALGFAETWDHKRSSTGKNHIGNAKTFVERALCTSMASELSSEEAVRLRFLTNTWIYMDVIARLTSLDDDIATTPTNIDLITACSHVDLASRRPSIDPLMGYAATLFPMIGHVADLASRVRRRNTKRNSPTILSQAVELKKAIEAWVQPIDLGATDDVTYNMSDSVQTAEAYRWAALLLLRQAVPELPSLFSWADLAQKILLFLATIPITSHTIIVQIFPLMVAGCEALDDEDRVWVTERWKSMSKRMVTGIVDRCLEVTTEVWRRRDEYAVTHSPPHSAPSPPLGFPQDKDPIPSSHTNTWCDFNKTPARDHDESSRCQCAAKIHTLSGMSDFPESPAFKRGADLLTRAGCIEYTVKGRLHWLGVMREWNWEVMLG